MKATLSIGILFGVSVRVGGRAGCRQQNRGIADCPTVAVSCPDNVEENSELHAYATVGGPGDKLKYHWTVLFEVLALIEWCFAGGAA